MSTPVDNQNGDGTMMLQMWEVERPVGAMYVAKYGPYEARCDLCPLRAAAMALTVACEEMEDQ